MNSIREIYRIGYGPSSSHTMGPRKAADQFKQKNKGMAFCRVNLYGSLAATGKGHLTDIAIIEALQPIKTEVLWFAEKELPYHPIGMLFEAFDDQNKLIDSWEVYSVGGGALYETGQAESQKVYTFDSMHDILNHLHKTGQTFWEYVEECEGKEIWDYLAEVWKSMQNAVERGLDNEGLLPGCLHLTRKASQYYTRSQGFSGTLKKKTMLFSYALAVSEENAGGGQVVTAPTCGSCGVLPAVLYHIHKDYEMNDTRILRALATAGVVGNLVKKNASISGAEVGCQGEIGTACAMAAAAATKLFGGTPMQIEYAAEMGIEHHLGLTCDPICGLVQIPCIERNAFAAARALDASAFAILSDGQHHISFDKIIATMKQTGHDLPSIYRETSIGGLAAFGNDDDN